jgi:hypothetical protein
MRHLLLALLLAGCTSTDTVSASAERNARVFASEMGLELKGVSCSGTDSLPADGYVSCTLNETSGQRTAIECGYDQTLQIDRLTNTACKMARPVTVMGQ